MSKYIQNGSAFSIASELSTVVHDRLPPGNYIIQIPPMGAPFLEKVAGFSLPSKVYGDTSDLANRILTTYQSRGVNTGALLYGDKGSGKSLLARMVCARAAEHGIPTIIVGSPLSGQGFAQLLASIDQEVVVFIDEFEKLYDEDAQEGMLSILDGVYASKKLFLLTANEMSRVGYYMRDRPGRVFYSIEFKGLSQQFVREYAEDRLIDKSKVDEMVAVSAMSRGLSFDVLQAIVEEVNRYGEPIKDALRYLNGRPTGGSGGRHMVSLFKGGVEVDGYAPHAIDANPMTMETICIRLQKSKFGDGSSQLSRALAKVAQEPQVFALEQESNDGGLLLLRKEDLVSANFDTGSYVYRKGDYEAHVTAFVHNEWSYQGL